MSKMNGKSRINLAVPPYQIHTLPKNEVVEETEDSRAMLKNKEIANENTIYVSQLQELARVFSSSGDRHIRQYIINLARGVLERAGDCKRVEGYIAEMLN